MSLPKLENVKQELDGLSAKLEELRSDASVIISMIDANKLLSTELTQGFSKKLEEYEKSYFGFCRDGEELQLKISDDINSVKAAIGEYEASLSMAKEKELVWDYFRLCSKDSSTKSALEDSKLLLADKCRNEEDVSNAIKPFKLVVNCVRDSITNLVDEVFDTIHAEIDKRIARAVDRGDLYIDDSTDIEKYLDGSCTLLTSPNAGDGGEDDRLEGFDGILVDCEISFADVKGECFSITDFKNDAKANPEIVEAIWLAALCKLLDPESETDLAMADCSKDTINELILKGYLAEAIVSYCGLNRKYCVLTSKGERCFATEEARKVFEAADALPSDILRIKVGELTPTLAAQISIIKEYAKAQKLTGLPTAFALPGTRGCAVAVPAETHTGLSTCVVAAFFNESTSTPQDFCTILESIEEFDAIVLVASASDAEKMHKFGAASNNVRSVDFVVCDLHAIGDDPDGADGSKVTWESLGVADPEKFIYKNKGIEFKDEKSKKAAKPFGVKEFKGDILKNPNSKYFIDVMRGINIMGYATAHNIAVFFEDEGFDYIPYCEKLFHLGYLRRIAIGENEPIYSITEKGNKAFTTKESAAVLHIKQASCCEIEDILSEKTVMLSQIYVMVEDLAKELGADIKNSDYLLSICPCSFACAYFNSKNEQAKNIAFVSIVCTKPNELLEFSELVEKAAENAEELVVCGTDDEYARVVADWLIQYNPEGISEKYIRLYNYEIGELVDFVPVVHDETQEEPASRDTEKYPAQNFGDAAAEVPVKPTEKPKTVTEPKDSDNPRESVKYDIGLRDNLVSKMLMSKEFYCASAYLAASAKDFDDGQKTYEQLAYAINDPLSERSYSSSNIFNVYFSGDSQASDYLVISAILRNYFLDHIRFDYDMQSLFDSIKECPVFSKTAKVKNIARTFMDFKKENGHGIDYYSDYRFSDGDSYEKNLKNICGEAKSLYASLVECVTKEKANNHRFLETKKIIFSRDGELAHALSYAANNDAENKELIRMYLEDCFMKDGTDISPANIDASKLDAIIDEAWEEAQEKLFFKRNNIKLVSGLRQNLISRIKEAATVLCRYCELSFADSITEGDKGFINYKRIRASLLNDLKAADIELKEATDDDGDFLPGRNVLCYTINEIIQKIEGTYNEDDRKFFYVPFLKTNDVLLDEKYLPVLSNVEELTELSAAARIEAFFKAEKKPLVTRIADILDGEDDYGSAELIINYLEAHPEDDSDLVLLAEKIKGGKEFPHNNIDSKIKDFEESLELAQFYGQIDNTVEDKKETILQVVEQWYVTTLETENFGFMYKILEAFRNKIKDDAIIRAEELEKNLEAYKTANAAWEENELVKAAVEKISERICVQNYSSAEDMLNRLQANDIEPETSYISTDYLSDFINDYSTFARLAGSTGTFQVSLSGHNKEGKGGKSLLDNWPKSFGVQAKKLEVLLTGLGFNVAGIITQQPIQRMDNFFVTLRKPDNGRKTNYKHPISIFGSSAEDAAFRVVCVYGKRKAEELVDLFNEIGNAKNTLIILDCALNLPERRELARLAKKNYNGKTFAVIDRVVITYLARNYSQTAINRMLMAIVMPFAYYQPYVAESSKVMPPEIFMGRKTELEKIESPSGVNIVYGGRQLGKSALLRMAQKDVDRDENGDRAILIDIKGLDSKATARKIAEELYDQSIIDDELPAEKAEDWHEIGRAIKNVLRNGNKHGKIPYLLLLLDEADVFIESCGDINYAPFDALKDIQSVGSGRFKFVVAGLRNVVRFNKDIALGNNSVLTHLDHVTVKPFKAAEARELLEVPLAYLGFRFPNDSKTDMLISNIFGATNYFPGLLQMYCAKLIEAMKTDYAGYEQFDTPPYVIREEHIKKALADKSLEQQIREKFVITLKVDEDDYYYQLALLVAFQYHNSNGHIDTTPKAILKTAEEYGMTKIAALSVGKLQALLDEMTELNVFQRVGKEDYRFTRRNFLDMMGLPQEIDDKMLEYVE